MKRTVATMVVGILLLGACGANDEPGTSADTTPAPATTPADQPSERPATAPATKPTESPTPTSESPTPAPAEQPADGTVITTGDSEFGEMIFDSNEQAIYMFDVEQTGTPECYDDCAEAWPPVLTDGTPQADGNIDPGLLGTTERSDGSTQVTYNDHPLYYYAHEAPGEVKCHNIELNGGLWYVLQPDGQPAPPG